MPSYSQQVSDAWKRQYGRDVNLNDPTEYQQYTDFARQMIGQLTSRDQQALAKSQGRWKMFDRLAMGAAIAVPTMGILSGLSGPGAAAASSLPAAATEGIAFDSAALAPSIEAASLGGATLPAAATAGIGFDAAAPAVAGGVGRGLLGGLTAQQLAALGLTGASLIGQATQKKPNMDPTTQTTDPNISKLIQSMQGRLDASDPLYRSILSMANGLLPMQYQNGGAGMSQAPPQTLGRTTGPVSGPMDGSGGPTQEDISRMTGRS